MPISLHVSLSDDTKIKLKEFAKNRKKSMTAFIEYALSLAFTLEEVDPKREAVLKRVIERKLSIPTGFTGRSFWLNIYMLGKKYPEMSSKDYWGAAIYRSAVDKTHGEILQEITEEWQSDLKLFL